MLRAKHPYTRRSLGYAPRPGLVHEQGRDGKPSFPVVPSVPIKRVSGGNRTQWGGSYDRGGGVWSQREALPVENRSVVVETTRL